MDIYIKDADLLLDQAGNLYQLSQNILRVQEDLVAACNKIANAWTSDTVDKESYLTGLNNELNRVSNLAAALNGLSNSLTIYAQEQKKNNNN